MKKEAEAKLQQEMIEIDKMLEQELPDEVNQKELYRRII